MRTIRRRRQLGRDSTIERYGHSCDGPPREAEGQLMASAPDPILLREEDAAAAIAMSARTLRKLRQAGEVDFVRVGGSVRYLREDLIDFAKRHRTCASTNAKARPTGSTRSPSGVTDIAAVRALRAKAKPRR
ncbi:MAG: helix-turn-helix domain-containing protein [Blastomonas sp.]